MAKKITSEQRELREKLSVFLDDVGISDVDSVKNLFKELVGTVLENGLEGELGYSKYDYRNKATDNSRNGHTEKTVASSFGDMKIAVPRDRNGDFEPKLIKKAPNHAYRRHRRENHLHVCQGHDHIRHRIPYP